MAEAPQELPELPVFAPCPRVAVQSLQDSDEAVQGCEEKQGDAAQQLARLASEASGWTNHTPSTGNVLLRVATQVSSEPLRLGGQCATQLFHELRTDVLALVISFLDVSALAVTCALDIRLRAVAGGHDHWRWFVLQFFGVYYDDYMRSVEVRDALRWRRLFVYIRQVHHNVDRKQGVRRTLPQLLRPCAWGPPPDDDRLLRGHAGRRRRYRGSLELADNCNVFFWENGRTVQVVCAKDGRILREIDTGQMFRRYFHRLANVKNRLFVCLNDCVKVWEYGAGDAHKPPVELPPPRRPPSLGKVGRPLELLVHRRRLILLESRCCLLWDTETFDFICCIQHEDPTPASGAEGAAAEPEVEVEAPRPLGGRGGGDGAETRALEVQWMGDLIVTWVRSSSHSLKVWTLEGERRAHLRMDSPLVQVDVARVTWVSVRTLDHFILAALDARSVVSLWDSKQGFCPIFRFYCGCDAPFDMVLTQDFMAVVNDNMADNRLEVCFWKLWLHPHFEAESDAEAAEAARSRSASVEPLGSPAGFHLSPFVAPAGGVGIGGLPAVVTAAGLLPGHLAALVAAHPAGLLAAPAVAGPATGELMRRLLHRELRPNARQFKRFEILDIDSYFASYRNFLNVCSFHKSGQESLSVYRSSSLQKKIFFPPAKHTKFEEWLALQVHNDGTVVLHDFRPGQVAFDELVVDEIGAVGAGCDEDRPPHPDPASQDGTCPLAVPRAPTRLHCSSRAHRGR